MKETEGIVPICDGEFHLENDILRYCCYICGKLETDDMLLIRTDGKKFRFACEEHPGIVQEFIKQYSRAPLGWLYRKGEEDGGTTEDPSTEHKG